MTDIILTQDDNAVIVLLAAGGGCSLDSSPKKNWVENGGGLPNYICKIARAVMKSGKTKSSAIAIAVSRVKKWAAGADGVDKDTQAKAAKAVAEWEALKAKHKAKKIVKASREHDGAEYLMFSNVTSYNTEVVRTAWDGIQRDKRLAWAAAHPNNSNSDMAPASDYPYTWIRELWTDFIIVSAEDREGVKYIKVPYTVNDDYEVAFGEPVPIEQQWIEVEDELDAEERELLGDLLLSRPQDDSAVGRLTRLASTLRV